MSATWLFYHFLKLEVHVLHGLENISIFNFWKLWLVRYDTIFGEMSLIFPKISEVKRFPFGRFPDRTLKVNNTRTAWLITVIYILFSSIWMLFHMKLTCFRVAVLL